MTCPFQELKIKSQLHVKSQLRKLWWTDVFCLSWDMYYYYNYKMLHFSEHTVWPLVLWPKRLVVPNPEPNAVPVVLDVGVPNRPPGFWPNAVAVVCCWPNIPGVAALLPNKLPKIRVKKTHRDCRYTVHSITTIQILYNVFCIYGSAFCIKKSWTPLEHYSSQYMVNLTPERWNSPFNNKL